MTNNIKLHTESDFKYMRKAGSLASKVLDFIEPFVKVGTTTAPAHAALALAAAPAADLATLQHLHGAPEVPVLALELRKSLQAGRADQIGRPWPVGDGGERGQGAGAPAG